MFRWKNYKQWIHHYWYIWTIVFMFVFCPVFVQAQSLSPSVITTAGQYSSSGGYSLSSTIGEPVNTTLQIGNVVLTQGQQQPYITLRLLHLKAFLEGAYAGNGQMQAILNTNFPLDYSTTTCDSVMVELHAVTSPYSLLASAAAILQTDGTATIQFPAAVVSSPCYIVLRHRNSIETWSKAPIVFNAPQVTFDFSAP